MKSVLIFVAVLATAWAACPRIETVYGLDLEKSMGMWQIHGVVNTSKPIDTDVKCYMNTLTGSGFETEPVKIDAELMGDFGGVTVEKEVDITVRYLAAPGRWSWTEDGAESQAFIMYSDYVQYSLMLICRGDHDQDHLEAHFMSRQHDPMPAAIVENFKDQLEAYGIDVSSYTTIHHDHNCGHH